MPTSIRFEHTVYPHWGGRSGYLQFVRHLDPRRFSVELHGTPDSDEHDRLPAWLTPFKSWLRRSIPKHGGMPWYKLVDLEAEIAAMDRCSTGELEIIHFLDGEHSGQFLPRAIKSARSSAVRTVATFHQPPDWEARIINPNLLRWFDAIVLVSPSQVAFFKQFVPEDRLHVILHGIDVDFFRPLATPKASEGVRCITTGHWLRDWETFGAVAETLREFTFDVVTRADSDFSDLPNVNMYSGISDAKLSELYRNADILFLPLIDSTANNTLLEGIASGLPVVTTDLESVRAYLPNNEAILISENRPEAFVDALQRLQRDVSFKREMGRRARARAEELAWPRVARQFEKFYEEMLRRRPIHGEHDDCSVTYSIATALDCKSPKYVGATPDLGTRLPCGSDYEYYGNLARTAEYKWRWKSAIDHWDRCIELMPDDIRSGAIARKAECLIQIGRVDQATELFVSIDKSFASVAGQARIVEIQDSPQAASWLWDRCTALFPKNLEGFLGKAQNLLDLNQYAEADQLLWHVISIWPNSRRAGVLWASNPTAARDWETANTRWRMVLGKHGSDLHVLRNYARYLAMSNISQGIEVLRTVMQDHPVIQATCLLEYYGTQNRYECATEMARKLVHLEQEVLLYRLQLARLLMSQRSNELQEAILLLRALCDQSPDSVLVKLDLIEAYIRADFEVEAAKILRTIPQSEKRVAAESMRAWDHHRQNNDFSGLKFWRTLFLNFEILRISKNV